MKQIENSVTFGASYVGKADSQTKEGDNKIHRNMISHTVRYFKLMYIVGGILVSNKEICETVDQIEIATRVQVRNKLIPLPPPPPPKKSQHPNYDK
ncbi:hypothetical protein GQX74_002893 [Glossina fuscipes]|nr:hypothetical protein GQX74_002893 [Glossina fuscipes]